MNQRSLTSLLSPGYEPTSAWNAVCVTSCPVQPTIAHRRPKAHGLVEMSIEELARTAMDQQLVVSDDAYEQIEISPSSSLSSGWFAAADEIIDDVTPGREPSPLSVPLVLIVLAFAACIGALTI